MFEFKLDIIIPSYQRPYQALDTVLALYRQINDARITITVLDNHSDVEYLSVFKSNANLRQALDDQLIKIVRHASNIGMSGNILRAFELTQAEWLWILSDDDKILDGCIELILKSIENPAAEIAQVHFPSSGCSQCGNFEKISSIDKFIRFNLRSTQHFNDLIFISSSIYKRSVHQKNISWGFLHAHTYVPHFIMSAVAVSQGWAILCLNQQIVKYQLPKIGYNYGLIAGLGLGGLKVFPTGINNNNVQEYLSMFHCSNHIKVFIDLYFYCATKNSPKLFQYYSNLYLNQIFEVQSHLKYFGYRFFVSVFLNRFIFKIFIKILLICVPSARFHINEMLQKYKPENVDGQI